MPSRIVVLLTLWIFAGAVARPAAAQDRQRVDGQRETEARRVFEAGEAAFTDARYGDALDYFNRAYELSHRPALLFNIGLCADRLRDDDAAVEAYERYLSQVPAAENRREVNGRLEALHRAQRRRAAAADVEHESDRDDSAEAHSVNANITLPAPPVHTMSNTPIYGAWWFWTIVGVVVGGSLIGIVAAASGDAPFQSGTVGGVIFTLGGVT